MSKASRIPDADRTAIMLDLLRRQHEGDQRGMSLGSVVLEEVAPGTGWSGACRFADVLVLGVWKSSGQKLHGFEIKASRADLRRELANLQKHEAIARYCDSWTLLAWDESVLLDGIPESWGIMLTAGTHDERRLTVKRKAAKRTPDPWPRHFVCSLVRNAYEQSPGAAFVARAVEHAQCRDLRQREREKLDAVRAALRPLMRALHGRDEWRWPPEALDPEKLVALAVERLQQLPLERSA